MSRAFIISAPAGTGKTTLIDALKNDLPQLTAAVTCTTRPSRPGEVDGQHYHFLTRSSFEAKLKTHAFLEHVDLYGQLYGTLIADVETKLRAGKHCLLNIDTQGAVQLMQRSDLPFLCTFIFVRPPSLDILRERLVKRATDTPDEIEKRLLVAKGEMERAKYYDYNLTNDNLAEALDILKAIITAESHRVCERRLTAPK